MPSSHRWPAWTRISAALLLAGLAGGQVWRHRPAGDGTELVLSLVEQNCPAAIRPNATPSVADGACAIDRYAARLLIGMVDRVRGRGAQDRCSASCTRTDTSAQRSAS